MMLLPILTAPDPRLLQKSLPVSAVDDEVRALMDRMLATMYAAPGIGLAAPQVGVLRRIIVIDVSPSDAPKEPLFLVNPEITWASTELAVYEEGCLSLPQHYAEVERPAAIRLSYIDRQNEPRKMEAEGLLATCIQHEIDHLEGTLFVDHISSLKRNVILRKLQKAKKLQKVAS